MTRNRNTIPHAESGALLKVVRSKLGKEFVVTDASSVWGSSWMRHLAPMDAEFGRIVGDQYVMGHFESEFGFSDTGLVSLKFEDEPLSILQYPRGYETVHMVFTRKKGVGVVRKLVKYLLATEHAAKELSIWGGRDIPLDKLDTANFVVPDVVENALASEVYPQLDDGEIFNHVLLFSYPGVGKTAFCRHLAKKYPDWKTVVVFPASVDKPRDIMSVFDYASYRTPAILIFEDIDAWAQTRYEDASFKEDFSPYLGALLNGVDGVESHLGLLVMATTNNPQSLDPAILRPGRFGVQVEFRYTDGELARICRNYLGEDRPDSFFRPYLRNSPAHIRALMKTARAYHKLNGVQVTHKLLKEINTLLLDSPKLPRLEDMFVRDGDEAEDKAEPEVGYR